MYKRKNNYSYKITSYYSFDELYTNTKRDIIKHLDETWGYRSSKWNLFLPNQKPINLIKGTQLVLNDNILLKCGKNKEIIPLDNFNILDYYDLESLNNLFREGKINNALSNIFDDLSFEVDYTTKELDDSIIITPVEKSNYKKLEIRFKRPQ